MQCSICFSYINTKPYNVSPNNETCTKCTNELAKGKKVVIVIKDSSTPDDIKRTGTILYVEPEKVKKDDIITYMFEKDFKQLIEEINGNINKIDIIQTRQEG